MVAFCTRLASAWADADVWGHPIEIGARFQHEVLAALLADFNRNRPTDTQMPYLAALVCCSPFDIALNDAYGQMHALPTYETYNARFMNRNIADLFSNDDPDIGSFRGKYPADFLAKQPARLLPVWHLVGGLDPLDESEFTGDEPNDGYPVALTDWIDRDGLDCLKVKLRGNDAAWDYDRFVRVGRIATSRNVKWLTADFNCTVKDPIYVTDFLDRLQRDEPRLFEMLLYVEQPFPYDPE